MSTDIHCHILPGIDDGAKELQQALAIARIAVEDGISTVFATPHHLNGVYLNPAQRVRTEMEQLQAMLDTEGIALRLLPRSEHPLAPELPDTLAGGGAITMGDFGCAVLVEVPVHNVPSAAKTCSNRFAPRTRHPPSPIPSVTANCAGNPSVWPTGSPWAA